MARAIWAKSGVGERGSRVTGKIQARMTGRSRLSKLDVFDRPGPRQSLCMKDPTPPDGSPHCLRRLPQRGSYDRAVIHAILDEGLFCSVGITTAAGPVVIPMVYARVG